MNTSEKKSLRLVEHRVSMAASALEELPGGPTPDLAVKAMRACDLALDLIAEMLDDKGTPRLTQLEYDSLVSAMALHETQYEDEPDATQEVRAVARAHRKIIAVMGPDKLSR